MLGTLLEQHAAAKNYKEKYYDMVNKSRSEKKLNQNQSMCANAKMYTPTKKKKPKWIKRGKHRKPNNNSQLTGLSTANKCKRARVCEKNISDVSRRKRKTAKNKYK